ncbi:hypothetical protein P0F65_20210 [Sphingomonas sp. I4]
MDAKHSSSPDFIAARLLAWYDRHARDLPWRSKPGRLPTRTASGCPR